MVLELKQTPKLIQQLVITPQLQQAIRLLQLTRLELVDLINEEMKENPLIDEDEEEKETFETGGPAVEKLKEAPPSNVETTPEVKGEGEGSDEFDWENYLDNFNLGPPTKSREQDDEDRPSFENFVAKKTTLFEHLCLQLQLSRLTEEERRAGTLIIGNLDEDGYLKTSTEEVEAETNLSKEEVEKVLKTIQQFDPAGVAARDLQECLLIQLEQLPKRDPLAEKIISEYLSQLKNRNYPVIARRLGVSMERVKRAASLISGLEPKPGRAFGGEIAQEIIPDVYVYKVEGEYIVSLNDDGVPRLRVNPYYHSLLKEGKQAHQEDRKYMQEKMRSALWLIKSIDQRQRTIYKVAKSIVNFQKNFLDHGVQFLKPLVLRDVAEDIQMHESTISRVTNNKYMHTPQGIYELKYFFNTSILSTKGEAMASESIKSLLREIINKEDPKKPYSDEKLVQILKEKNIPIARRTISKYREMLKILSSSERRKVG